MRVPRTRVLQNKKISNNWEKFMKKSKKIIVKTAAFLAAITLCAGLNFVCMPKTAAITVSAQTKSSASLADEKSQAKAELTTYFDGFAEDAYGEAEWAALAKIESEGYALIDDAADAEAVENIVAGIKYAAECVLTEEEKPAFAEYVAEATANVQNAFVASLYRDAERAEGEALVEETKNALAKATTYAEAEALELSALAKIDALKTAAEWEAEESMKPVIPDTSASDLVEEPVADKGCASSMEGITAMFSVTTMFALMGIVNKKKEGK